MVVILNQFKHSDKGNLNLVLSFSFNSLTELSQFTGMSDRFRAGRDLQVIQSNLPPVSYIRKLGPRGRK